VSEPSARSAALGELAAARAILLDAKAPASAALEHLRRAHEHAGADSEPPDATDSRRALAAWADQIDAGLASGSLSPRWRWGARAAAWIGGLALVVGLWRATGDDIEPGPWRARYYATADFSGDHIERRENDVNFRWQQRRPLPALGRDHFSATFETCLRTWKPRNVRFHLVANNGVRFSVDGNVVVDETSPRGVKVGPAVELDPGVHHLRVDYVERKGRAEVVLRASLDGARPQPLNSDRLDYPNPGANPCPAK